MMTEFNFGVNYPFKLMMLLGNAAQNTIIHIEQGWAT